MEFCCYICAGAPSCSLELLDKLQKRICRTVGPLLAASLEPIVEMLPPKVFSIGVTLVDVHLTWLNWFHFLIFEEGLLVILTDCVIFLSPFLDVIRISISSFFSRTARLEFSAYRMHLFDLKTRIDRHLLSVGSF